MRYLGGKSRLARHLAPFLLERLRGRVFVEPFCGALNITAAMAPAGVRVASDLNPYLLTLYRALREGWTPPEHVTREDHARLKAARDPADPMTAFVGYGYSFGGDFFCGYLTPEGKNGNPRRSLLRKLERCADVVFARCTYERLRIDAGCLVYCDPPYAGTTGYSAVEGFDPAAFWETARRWTRAGAEVYVSEYTAPDDFVSVWSTDVQVLGVSDAGKIRRTVEHLFTMRNVID